MAERSNRQGARASSRIAMFWAIDLIRISIGGRSARHE
jgi:hypothetical protein